MEGFTPGARGVWRNRLVSVPDALRVGLGPRLHVEPARTVCARAQCMYIYVYRYIRGIQLIMT